MDEVDAVPRPRRQRPKDSFQNELQAKLHQRRSLGLSAEISESEEEISSSRDLPSNYYTRPGSAMKRADRSPDLSRGLGTTTMGTRDLTSLLRNSREYDDEDEEVMAANLGRSTAGRHWQSSGMKTPSPVGDSSKFLRKGSSRESPQGQSGKLDSIFGSKTPTKEASPRSKEDIIFGRKTPSSDGKKSPYDGSRRLPGVDDKPWQPPSFRTASPNSPTEHSRGSRGVTPVDSTLESISETPREKGSSKGQRSEWDKSSPQYRSSRSPGIEEKPKPPLRGKLGERKTPPLVDSRKTPPLVDSRKTPPQVDSRKTPPMTDPRKTSPLGDPRRRSPSYQADQESNLKRATPSFDLFGSRPDEGYLRGAKGRDEREIGRDGREFGRDGRELGRDGREIGRDGSLGRSGRELQQRPGAKTPEGRWSATQGLRDKSLEKKTDGRFVKSGTQSPLSPEKGRFQGGKREVGERSKSPQKDGSSLLDFLMEDSGQQQKPKPQERSKKPLRKENQVGDDMFDPTPKPRASMKSKSPGLMRKSSEKNQMVPDQSLSALETMPSDYKQQRPEDTSSICEDIPPDPNSRIAKQAAEASKPKNQTLETAEMENAINTISEAQNMQYIAPAKRMRPVTASAKVQHRPKPRYGVLPGEETKTLQERQFSSTGDIRDAIYEEWYKERMRTEKLRKKEKKKKEEEEEKKKNEAKKEKLLEAKQSYDAWMKQKKVLLQEKREREEEIRKEKEKEEEEKKKPADSKAHERWVKRKRYQEWEEKKKREEKEAEEKADKAWKEKEKERERMQHHKAVMQTMKEDLRKEKEKRRREKELEAKRKREEYEQREREQEEARERYEEWMEKKERQHKLEKQRARQRKLREEDEYRQAWFPASRTIPFGR